MLTEQQPARTPAERRTAIRLWPLGDGEYSGQVVGADGTPALTLRSATSLEAMQSLVAEVRARAAEPEAFRMLDIGDTRFAFGVEGADHRLLATSNIFGSREARSAAVASLSRLLGEAPVVVMSQHP